MGKTTLTIYLDLDHTLLDTEKLKRAFARSLAPLGVTAKQFWIAYRTLRRTHAFTLPLLVRFAVKDARAQKKAQRVLEATTRRAARFLYADTLPFLRRMKKGGARLVLFSYGHPPYIRMKIQSIPQYKKLFDRIIITPHERKTRLLPLWKGPRIYIDNRADVVRHYAKRQGMIPFVLTRGSTKGFSSLAAIQKTLADRGLIACAP